MRVAGREESDRVSHTMRPTYNDWASRQAGAHWLVMRLQGGLDAQAHEVEGDEQRAD